MKPLNQRQVHLDFHTSEDVKNVGSCFDKSSFQRCLKKGHVNSITLFAKCHHGWMYYPSKAGKMHPNLNFDLLSAQLEACREIGVDAPIYLSGGFDNNYYYDHPEDAMQWAREAETWEIKATPEGRKYADCRPHYHLLCFNSPYFDKLMGEVREVVETFRPIGIFIDIVAERVCYCPHCMKLAKSLGMDTDDDETFRRLAVLTYKKYTDTVREIATSIKPDIRIFHNGGHIKSGRRALAYTNTHLELESLPTGGWGYDHFPKSAKYASHLGLDYLGMTGKFHLGWGEFGGFKHPNALRYEVALSLAHGAKCSVGDQMHPYAFMDEATYESIGIAYGEAEAVEEYCYGVKPVADIAVLMAESYASNIKATDHIADIGACRMLLESHKLFDCIDQDCDFDRYKLIIVPDASPTKEIIEKLETYVSRGGKIIASGAGLPGEKIDLGAIFKGKCEYKPAYFRPHFNALGLSPTNYVIYTNLYEIDLKNDARVLGSLVRTFFNRTPEHYTSHRHTPFNPDSTAPVFTVGRDGAYIGFDVFTEYAEIGPLLAKETVIRAIDEVLLGKESLKTNLPVSGVVTLNLQEDKSRYVLHALYATPHKRGGKNIYEYAGSRIPVLEVIEDLPLLYNTEFEIALPKRVKRVMLVPENREIKFETENERIKFVLDEFSCKQVVSIEY